MKPVVWTYRKLAKVYDEMLALKNIRAVRIATYFNCKTFVCLIFSVLAISKFLLTVNFC